MTKTVGILGGTFDPPHLGHMEMAHIALDSGEVDEVVFLPCWQHAFGKEPSSFQHRVRMCELAVEGEDSMAVSPAEGTLKSTHSIEILTALKKTSPSMRLIMGADNYWKMDKWKEPQQVMELAPPLWIQRVGSKQVPDAIGGTQLRLSSTHIRELILACAEIPDGCLHPMVHYYIRNAGLYLWAPPPML